jgi:HAD superfamily hydrolase (TIGR01549 family)
MRYKAVLFDLDDTLLQTSKIKWAHHKAVAKQFYNIDLTDDVIKKHWGMPLEPMMAIFYQNADTAENMLKANLSLEHQFPKQLLVGADVVVRNLLAHHIEVGVITSTIHRLAKRDLERYSFPVEEFLLLQGSDDEPAHKPDPHVFDLALSLLDAKGISPDQTLYVGDALMDYYAARDAGMGFLGVTTGLITQQEFEAEGARTVLSLDELRAS